MRGLLGGMSGAPTIQYYFVFPGTGTNAGATPNVVTIKYEDTKTTPYQTTLRPHAKKAGCKRYNQYRVGKANERKYTPYRSVHVRMEMGRWQVGIGK